VMQYSWVRHGAGLGVLLWLGAVPVLAHSLEEIRGRGKLIVGIYVSNTPLAQRTAAGELEGVEIELGRTLAEALFNKPAVEWKILSAKERLPALETGTVDLVLGNLTVTEQRTRAIDFSRDYYRSRQVIVVQATNRARKLSDLDNAKIAVFQKSSSVTGLQLLLPKATIVEVTSYEMAQELLRKGEVQGISADNTTIIPWLKQDPTLRLLATPLQGYVIAAGLPKGLATDDFRVWVDERLKALKEQNWLTTTLAKWGL